MPFSDVRTTNNIKALNLKGDDFRVDGAFVLLRVPAEEASRALTKWRGRYGFMKAGEDPSNAALVVPDTLEDEALIFPDAREYWQLTAHANFFLGGGGNCLL